MPYLHLGSAIFWDHRLVITYRCFEKTHRSHLQGSSSPRTTWPTWLLKKGPICCPSSQVLLVLVESWRWDRYVYPKRSYRITNLRYVRSQTSADHICIAAEAWYHAYLQFLVYFHGMHTNNYTFLFFLTYTTFEELVILPFHVTIKETDLTTCLRLWRPLSRTREEFVGRLQQAKTLKVKVKCTLGQTTKAQRGSTGIALLFI